MKSVYAISMLLLSTKAAKLALDEESDFAHFDDMLLQTHHKMAKGPNSFIQQSLDEPEPVHL